MRRRAAALAVAFVASLVVAAYGHCWPMLTAQMHHVVAAEHHDAHGDHQPLPHEHGPELMVSCVPSVPPADLHAPAAKPLPPIPLATAMLQIAEPAPLLHRRHSEARAGPFAFRDMHARTGRLLI